MATAYEVRARRLALGETARTRPTADLGRRLGHALAGHGRSQRHGEWVDTGATPGVSPGGGPGDPQLVRCRARGGHTTSRLPPVAGHRCPARERRVALEGGAKSASFCGP